MSRYIKERMVEQYAERFREVSDVAAVATEGVDANRMVALRAALHQRGLEAMRVQNRLCRRAIQDGPLAGADSLLDGPITLVWGADGIVDIAKALAEQAKDLSALEIRGGFSQGEVLSSEQIEALSKLPGREELIGQVVARAVGQASRVVRLAATPAGGLLAQIRELEKRGPTEPSGEAQPAEAQPEEKSPDEETAPADQSPKDEEPSAAADAGEAPVAADAGQDAAAEQEAVQDADSPEKESEES